MPQTVRTSVNGFTSGSGYTNIAEGLQAGQLQLNSDAAAVPKYMILLSDGGANRPSNITDVNESGGFADWGNFYIDVNDNGYRDSDDNFSISWGTGKTFQITAGLLQITRGGTTTQRENRVMNLFGVNNNNVLDNGDNYTFPELGNANFQIYHGSLYLAQSRNPPPAGTPVFDYSPTDPPNWTSGNMTYDLAVLRTGAVWQGTTDLVGDGSDVYAGYLATQAKKAGTFIYVIGYALTDANVALNQAMASPGGFFEAEQANVGAIFEAISQRICGVTVTKSHQGANSILKNTTVAFNIELKNTGTANATNIVLTDTYPISLTYQSSTPPFSTHNVGTRTLVWQNLPPTTWTPGTTGSVSITFLATGVGTAQNCASISGLSPTSVVLLNGPSCDSISVTQPTAATLNAFEVKTGEKGKNVQIQWETGTELAVRGFNVLRSNKRNGELKPVNDEVIQADAMGRPQGATYKFKDKGLKSGKRYFYRLEVVGTGGTLELSEIKRVRLP